VNPLTRLVIAAASTVATIVLTGYVSLIVLLVGAVVVPALAAGVGAAVTRRVALVAAPVVVAVVLVSALTRSGAHILFLVGPFDVTAEGVDFAARITLRLIVMAGALVLFGLTTPVRSVVADLERRGTPPGLTYAVTATLDAVPQMLERGRTIRDAQRARGLDTEGSIGARLRGVLPLAGPAVLGAIHDVEGQTLALETRGFGRPGRRHVLWAPPDSYLDRLVRWALFLAVVVVVAGTAAGAIAPLP
jgi:energy-coupling factor transporter transmembrane protein EcfT